MGICCLCKRKKLLQALLTVMLVFVIGLATACSDQGGSFSGQTVNEGYLGTELTGEELKDSIKTGKITDASDLLYNFPEKTPGTESDKFDLNMDTLHWLNATYAIQLEANDMTYSMVAGVYKEDEEDVENVQRMLEEGWGYVAGYITLDEYVFQSVPIGFLIQREYESWEQVGKVYLEGYKYWNTLDVEEKDDIEYMMMETAYDMLCEHPYSLYNSESFQRELTMEREVY